MIRTIVAKPQTPLLTKINDSLLNYANDGAVIIEYQYSVSLWANRPAILTQSPV